MHPQLVKVDVVLAILGRPADKVYALADGGLPGEPGFLWTFNMAANPNSRCREIRFWMPEVTGRAAGDPKRFHGFNLDQVLEEILPLRRMNFRAGELDQLFQLRRNVRLRLLNGERSGRNFLYSRALLVDFLKRRWIGAGTN